MFFTELTSTSGGFSCKCCTILSPSELISGRDKKMGKSKFSRKNQGRNNKGKVSKSRKDRQHNKKNKAAAAAAPSAAPAAASVSKENENYDSHDLETVAAFKVSLADTYTHPKWIGPDVSGAAYTFKSWSTPRIGAPRNSQQSPGF